MTIKTLYVELLKSEVFKSWKAENEECYLAHAFAILDPANKGEWQFGFYDNNKDVMTSFFMNENGVIKSPEAEVFKKEDSYVRELRMDVVKVDFDEAMKIAEKCQQENYKDDKPLKKIMLLQCLDLGTIWNISFFTERFNVLNIRIDAKTKKISEHKLNSMMDFSQEVVKGEGGKGNEN